LGRETGLIRCRTAPVAEIRTIEASAGRSGSLHPPIEVLEYSFNTSTYSLVIQISSHSHSVACYIVRLLHQLCGAFGSRLDCTFERFGIPDVMSHDGQYTNRRPQETYRKIRILNSALGGCGFPSSSKAGSISNAESTQATTMYRVRMAKRLPGQALGARLIATMEGVTNIPYLLPDPNVLSSGLNTRGFTSPSLRNLSGLKASGSG